MCLISRLRVPHLHADLPWRDWMVLVLAVLVAYANAFAGDFQFDDYQVIVDNPSVHSWGAWLSTPGQGFLGIRPLLKLSYLLNWTSTWGAPGFHLVNFAIHLGTTGLVYQLVQMFLQEMRGHTWPQALPLWSALLFAVHPVNTEAITYVSGRSSSLMTLLYLAALVVYASTRVNGSWVKQHLLVPALLLLALAVKETAVTLVLALWVWELSLGTPWRLVMQRQWSCWMMLVAGALFFLLNDNYLSHMRRSAEINSLAGNLATQATAFSYLMRQWALPLWLNIDPDLPTRPGLSGSVVHLLSMTAALGLAWALRRRRPWISFAALWTLAHLVPLYIFLPRLDVANDRQLYQASWPLAMALLAELSIWLTPATFTRICVLLVTVLTGLTVARNHDYRSEIALWEATVKLSPNKARAHNNLGHAYQLAGQLADARREYTSALHLDPTHIRARHNLERLNSLE